MTSSTFKKLNLFILVLGLFFVLYPTASSATVIWDIQDALEEVFEEATITQEIKTLTEEEKDSISKTIKINFDKTLDKEFIFYIVEKDGAILGHAAEGKAHGKHGIIHFLVVFNTNKSVQKVFVLEYKEKRGKPVAYDKFLDQFIDKTTDDKIKLKKDIDGVSGATISSTAITQGVRKLLHVFNALY